MGTDGQHDGSEGEPTHRGLYDKVYTERAADTRTPKTYPEAEHTFPTVCLPSDEYTPTCQGSGSKLDL